MKDAVWIWLSRTTIVRHQLSYQATISTFVLVLAALLKLFLYQIWSYCTKF